MIPITNAMSKAWTLWMLARRRWGDVSKSVRILLHENGNYSVRVFYTLDIPEDGMPVRAELSYSSYGGETREMITLRETEKHTVMYYEVLDD